MNNEPVSAQQNQATPQTIWSKNKFKKSTVFSNCKYCCHLSTCPQHEDCEFLPVSSYLLIEPDEIERIRRLSSPSPGRWLRTGVSNRYTAPDDKAPTYQYHRRIINECLADIRAGHIGYLYTQQCLHDLFCFEPTANVTKQDGIYYITLVKGEVNGTNTTNAS